MNPPVEEWTRREVWHRIARRTLKAAGEFSERRRACAGAAADAARRVDRAGVDAVGLLARGAPAARQRHKRQVDRIGDTVLGEDGARRVGDLLAAASPGLADPEEVDRRGGHGGEEEEHFQRAEREVRLRQALERVLSGSQEELAAVEAKPSRALETPRPR